MIDDDYARAIVRVGDLLGVGPAEPGPEPDAPMTWHVGPGPVVRFYRGATCIADVQLTPDEFLRFTRDCLAVAAG